jgi:MFS family permease
MERRPLARLFPVLLLNLTAFGVATPVLPALLKVQGATGLGVGAAFALQALGQLVMGPVWGALSDRYGRRPVLLATIGLAAGLELLTAMSPALWATYVLRALVGLCAGNVACASALISDATPPKERSRGMMLIGIAFGLGFTLGPAAGALVSHLAPDVPGMWGIGAPFVLAAALDLVALALGALVLIEARTEANARAAVRARRDLVALRALLARPGIRRMGELFVWTSLGLTLLETSFFLYMSKTRGWDEARVGALLGAMGLWSAFLQGVLRRSAARLGDRRMALWGCGLLGAGLVIAPLYEPLWFLVMALGVAGAGRALMQPGAMALMSQEASAPQEAGEVMGVMQSANSFGRLVGPPIGGALFDWVWVGAPFVAAGVLVWVGAMRWVWGEQEALEVAKK